MISLLLLAVSASAAVPSGGYERALAAATAHEVRAREIGVKDGSMPFQLVHRDGRRAKSVLMLHGLSDSPHYMRTLGYEFYMRGYNVIAILLPGHGTRQEELLTTSYSQWRHAVAAGVAVARELGEEVSLAGFSTGGALALDAVAEHFSDRALVYGSRPKLGDVFLFAPAIRINAPAEDLRALAMTCPAPAKVKEWIRPWVGERVPEDGEGENEHRYNTMASHAACQLYHLTKMVENVRPAVLSTLRGKGVFVAVSDADQRVSVPAIESFYRDLPVAEPNKRFVGFRPYEHVAHADTTRPERNAGYGRMIQELHAFIDARGGDAPPGPLAVRHPASPRSLAEPRF